MGYAILQVDIPRGVSLHGCAEQSSSDVLWGRGALPCVAALVGLEML